MKSVLALTTTTTERVRVLHGRAVVSARHRTVDIDAAKGVERAIPRREGGVLARICNDRADLSVPTSLLCSKKELATEK